MVYRGVILLMSIKAPDLSHGLYTCDVRVVESQSSPRSPSIDSMLDSVTILHWLLGRLRRLSPRWLSNGMWHLVMANFWIIPLRFGTGESQDRKAAKIDSG
uniref:Uncharacterized protein n=1 Tax=Physcomitrium patens TaxID=3218 RepID=A0A2K1JRC2_PHYPA|nr:hypothetical protein PHYPA_016467 [Physcomitrium patens]